MTRPCECPTEEIAHARGCRRAGQPMTGRLWELCSGHCPPERPCTSADSEAYRDLWDREVRAEGGNRERLAEEKSPADRHPLDCRWRGEEVKGPDGRALTRECGGG